MRLLIAEKPSAARDIAEVLGADASEDDYLTGNEWIVTWCIGHVTQLAPPAAYRDEWGKWSLDSLPILPNTFRLQVSSHAQSRWSVLEELLGDESFEFVVNACDAGREGELIFRNVYRHASSPLPVQRLWLSDLTPRGIEKALDNLEPGEQFDNLGDAARARSEADWLIGLNATRALTLSSDPPPESDVQVLSLGRVQTPTLALIVERDRTIAEFEPTSFWRSYATFDAGAGFEAEWYDGDTNRIWDRSAAETILEEVRDDAVQPRVRTAETNRTKSHPPKLYDLTALQKEMNAARDLTSEETLEAAQQLYEDGFLTYPRTDSRALPTTISETLEDRVTTQGAFSWLEDPAAIDVAAIRRHIDDDSVSDHHAIIPTSHGPDPADLEPSQKAVYEAVARRFLAGFYPPAEYDKMRVEIDVADHTFRAEARAKVVEGWHVVDPPKSSGDDLPDSLPSLEPGDTIDLEDTRLYEGETRPPNPYNENSLLTAMENAGSDLDDKLEAALDDNAGGLGTPATRANIIEKLLDRGYIHRTSGQLRATDLGRALIDQLPDTDLTSPELTARWETALKLIEDGKLTHDDFLTRVKDRTVALVNDLTTAAFDFFDDGGLGPCPVCDAPVFQAKTVYTCKSGRDCEFVLSRTICEKSISPTAVETLLEGEATKKYKGFTSSGGDSFAARLELSEDGTDLEFVFDD